MTLQQEQTARQIIQKLITDKIQFGMEAVASIMTKSGLHDPERIRQIIAEETAPNVVTEPTMTQTTVAVETQTAESEEPGPLTENEAIHVVQSWIAQDAEYELPERRTFEEMTETLQDAADVRGSEISTSAFKDIVAKYAPDAPHRLDAPSKGKDTPPYPPELRPLVESGFARFEDGYWLVRRCDKCGQFKNECCGQTQLISAVRQGEKELTSFGRQAVGLDPIVPPKSPKSLEQIAEERKKNWVNESWWTQFRGAGELEGNGTVKMYIENFLPEGATLICGLPKEGKSFLALSVAKALTTGKPLFGKPGFEVPEIVPVLYLAAESGDGALKLRCEKFGITKDKTRFISRTLSQGLMLGLDSPEIESVVRAMKPVVLLETLIRFNDGKDEDDASENRKLAEAIFRLIAWGARAVIGIHHSRKDLNKANPTKEAAVRGSGDGLAMVDAVWLVMQDDRLYQRGKGPNEVDVVGWGRDFNPVPLRLALTRKAEPKDTKFFAPGIVSCVDTGGDMKWVNKGIVFEQTQESAESLKQTIERLVIEDPTRTKKAIAEKTDLSEWEVRNVLKRLGYHRSKGGKKGATYWTKDSEKADLSAIH